MNPLLEALHNELGTECPIEFPLIEDFDWEAAGIETKYIVCITPRSGSTWLTKLLAATELCGSPREFFNEKVVPTKSRKLGASSFQEYFCGVVASSQSGSTFGFVTNLERMRSFAELVDVESVFVQHGTRFLSLFRRDLLSQAISTVKAIKSGIWHRNKDGVPFKRPGAFANEETRPVTDLEDKAIWWWILNLMRGERAWSDFFDRHRLVPLQFYYEDLTTANHYQVFRILRHILDGRIELDAALLDKVAGVQNETKRLADDFTWRVWTRFTFEYFEELETLYRQRSTLDLNEFRSSLISNHGLKIAKLLPLRT